MIPLVTDVLWAGLAVSISGGLLFISIFTMLFVPTLYAIVFNVRGDDKGAEPTPAPAAA